MLLLQHFRESAAQLLWNLLLLGNGLIIIVVFLYEGELCFLLCPANLLSEEKASDDEYNNINSSSLIKIQFILAGLLNCLL